MFRHRIPVLVAALALAALTTAATSAAAPVRTSGSVTKNLTYTCNFPLIGQQQVNAVLAITFPDSVAVGSVIQPTDFSVGLTLPDNATAGLRLIGATTVEGDKASAGVDVKINDTEIGVTLNGLAIPNSPVPETGPTSLTLSGPIPGLTPKAAGQVSFALGSTFAAQITPKKADGTPTGLGTFDPQCSLDPGQDVALATITVS
ncbi:hypothetical protein GCM10010174_38340 [Kutzneria viridogrisea]|uniref:Putative secreted protein n=1 Tax=Kutzneria albida DSM 43870 TaxID=1449976 RepID=W5WFW6_9PSEU|nr:putative secreted protein [Kutzneria albida DSM 43870]